MLSPGMSTLSHSCLSVVDTTVGFSSLTLLVHCLDIVFFSGCSSHLLSHFRHFLLCVCVRASVNACMCVCVFYTNLAGAVVSLSVAFIPLVWDLPTVSSIFFLTFLSVV